MVEEPLTPVLDVSGWDLAKALRLLYRGNMTLFEWLGSPVVYAETDFSRELRGVLDRYFQVKKGIYHYLHMAKGNERAFLREDMVKLKKYFYVLRPLLAGRWILLNASPPPVLFSKLVESVLDPPMRLLVRELLERKQEEGEGKLIPRIGPLHRYIEQGMRCLEQEAAHIKEERNHGWGELNEVFLSAF